MVSAGFRLGPAKDCDPFFTLWSGRTDPFSPPPAGHPFTDFSYGNQERLLPDRADSTAEAAQR